MNQLKLWGLASLSGISLALAWPETGGLTALILFGLIGLLRVEDEIFKTKKDSGKKVFAFAYVSFLIFNLITTWWIYFASPWGAVAAVLFNTLFMAVVFWLFHMTKKWIGKKEGYIALIIYWIAFEYLHLNWDLSWPWLTLGNVFSNQPELVQWYEYTGVLGGTFWILVANLLFFFFVEQKISWRKDSFNIHRILPWMLFVLLPIFWSKSVYKNYPLDKEKEKLKVVLIQPNIDPYHDKFGGMSETEQIDIMIALSRSKVDEETDLLILPETAFPSVYWEHQIEELYGTQELRKIIDDFPQLRIIVGLASSVLIPEGDNLPATAAPFRDGYYYENFNTAIQLEANEDVAIYHKSKLVLGVEKVPFLKYFPFMQKLSINLGGAAGGFGTDEYPTVFFDENEDEGLAPIICYESVYGEYVNEYAKRGAALYVIITNDGWWDNSPGYKQHLAYARLRAIEGRKDIIRSANTGISAIINARGDVVSKTEWWVPDALEGEANLSYKETFYIKHGDYIGRVTSFVAVLLLLLTLVKALNKTEQKLKM